MAQKKKEMKINLVKGCPMLHWVGKKALGVVQNFPAQLRERMGVKSAAAQPNYRAFMGDAGHNLLLHGDNMRDIHLELRATPMTLGGFGFYADTGFKWENGGETQAHYGNFHPRAAALSAAVCATFWRM